MLNIKIDINSTAKDGVSRFFFQAVATAKSLLSGLRLLSLFFPEMLSQCLK